MENAQDDAVADCEKLSDAQLVRETKYLAGRMKHNEIQLLVHLAEFDSRRLCLEEGYRSLYEYCTTALGFEEGEAYRRIRVARVIRGFPETLDALRAKRVTASALVVLSPWLERSNVREWLAAADGKSRRELEALVAARYPQAPQPDAVRNYPFHPAVVGAAPPLACEALEAAPASVESRAESAADAWQQLTPISSERVRVGFDAAAVVAGLLVRVRQLLRHKYPEGRLEDLIREALEDYLDRKDPLRKLERKTAPAADDPPVAARIAGASRYIPAKVKSAVWARDEGRCAWRDPEGTPCGSKDWIEYDHIRPFARGGRSDDARNIRLVCRQHNQAAALAAGLSAGRGSGG